MTGVAGRSAVRFDPEAVRRDRADDKAKAIKWIDLPPEGNASPVPAMPIPPKYESGAVEWSERAKQTWQDLWKSPQSTMWQPHLHPVLDRYIFLIEMMWLQGSMTGAILTAVGKIEDSLGLTPKAMALMWWRIKAKEPEPLASVEDISIKRKRIIDY